MIVVVGGGHAGCEAALAAARLGRPVVLVTMERRGVARLSCNPAIGGLAKGTLVREIDALGGAMARVTDETTIQFRRLNTRKGVAVQASRAQVDVALYPAAMQAELAVAGVTVLEGEAAGIRVEGGRATGVILGDGPVVPADAVVLTTGTFLSAVMHCGEEQRSGGRLSEPAAARLSASLAALGLRLFRLKTGTTPRLDGRTIDWSRLRPQPDCHPEGRFSFAAPGPRLPQRDCWIAHTAAATHDLIRAALPRSPLYAGAIVGRGPRYCPSIEDKVVRFAGRERHQLFLEPEGLTTDRVYVNGLSTSLPRDVQDAVVASVAGLESATILQYGYAVEYDAADPTDLDAGLQHRALPGLWCAGQINGTSGYEEAAAQGLVAGANAAGVPLRLGRDRACTGVMVDDLVTRGPGGEPWRMFPSRAEHRLHLREDNADRRLMPLARSLGLLPDAAWERYQRKEEAMARLAAPPELRRPEVGWRDVWPEADPEVAEQVEIEAKYAGYIRREHARMEETRRMEDASLEGVDFAAMRALSTEVRERLARARPASLGEASRLPGITPAAVHVLAAEVGRRRA
jgi:tRNA uridine 5-carboxymethylaminomethyl modification enzyme